MIPHTTTNAGLHEFVASQVLAKYAREGLCAVDLGSGPGAMASQLHALGCNVLAVDRNADGFMAGLPHVAIDFDRNDFACQLGRGAFDIITAIEVIEHVESPIGFLRNVRSLLAPTGVAIITTPNVDCLPARVKFFLTGRIRTMDEFGEPTHISPIFWDLLRRQFLPRAGLNVREHLVFPTRNYQLSRKLISWTFRIASTFLSNECVFGDNHVLVLKAICQVGDSSGLSNS